MIRQFNRDTALLMIDVQDGVDVLEHWGGDNGRRNNPDAETHIAEILTAWRSAGLPVCFTAHDSREAASPLKLSEQRVEVQFQSLASRGPFEEAPT